MTGSASRKGFSNVPLQPRLTVRDQSDSAVSERIRSPRAELWLNVGRTCNLTLCNVGLGFTIALHAVALPDLGEIYSTSMSEMSRIFTTYGVGLVVGSLIGGKLYDTYNTQVVTIIAMALNSCTVLLIPLSGSLPLAHVMVFFTALSMDALFTGTTVWIMKMWPENSSPALQLASVANGVGSGVAPFIARPFLSTQGVYNENLLAEIMNMTLNDTGRVPIEPLERLNTTALELGATDSTIYFAFVIVSAFQLVLVASMMALYFIDSTSFKTRRTDALDNATASVRESARYTRFVRITLALLCAYGIVYYALGSTISSMLMSFAVKCDLHFSKPMASRLAAVYFFSSTASRLAAALVGIKLPPFYVLATSEAFLVTAATVLLTSGSTSATALWLGSALAGIGHGPLNGAAMAWVANHINVTNMMMSVFMVITAIGIMSSPSLVGHFLDHNPNVFLYVCFANVILSVAFFAGMSFHLRKQPLLREKRLFVVNFTDEKSL